MSVSQHTARVIEDAFGEDQSLKQRILGAITHTPQHGALFEDIAKYTQTARGGSGLNGAKQEDENGHAAKRRKLANGETTLPVSSFDPPVHSIANDISKVSLEIRDISFSIPQRKKLNLTFTGDYRTNGVAPGSIQGVNPSSAQVEFTLPVSKIQHALCLPVPEKAQRQFNLCLIPTNGDGLTRSSGEKSDHEPMVWTVPDQAAKSARFLDAGDADTSSRPPTETYESLLHETLDHFLATYGKSVIYPDENEFASAVPEAHRKGEKAFHVKAFRGSKDGFLFFLSTGVFFGFKKPLLFFAFENVESISYTSVLQRTFNLNVAARASDAVPTEEIEFSMIDQAHFAGIDAYVKKHSLQDASMAEARRAKKLNVNAPRKGAHTEMTEDAEQEGELAKAQRELEDQEDEEEEDYDPGSEGQSDGSGTSSEEEEEEDGGEEAAEGDDEEDIVQDELGSEAEEVAIDDEDQL